MEHTLGKRIMTARKGLGLTQDQLAERLGVTAQAVSKWENDQSCPDITMLPKLAELFGITTDQLLGREIPVRKAEAVDSNEEPEGNGIELHWDPPGKRTRIGFAVLVLLIGGLLLTNTLLGWGASFWDILWPTALIVFGWSGGFSFIRLCCFLLGAYPLAGIIFDLHINNELIFPIILLLLGASLLFDIMRKPKRHWKNNFQIDGEGFTFSNSFGEQTQLITMPRLSRGNVSVSFGECTLDLSGVEALAEECQLDANCRFGELTMLVPRRFRVQCESSTSFGCVETHGQPDPAHLGTILVCADARFSQINVRYI